MQPHDPASTEHHDQPHAHGLREPIEHALEDVEQVLHRKPASTAAIVGGAVLAAAVVWGASEAAVAAVAGWLVYRGIRRRMRNHETH